MKVKLVIISIILLLVVVFASGCIPVMEKLGLVNPVNEEQLSPEKGGPPDGLVKVLIGFKEKPGPAQQALVNSMGGKIKYAYNFIPAMAASIPEKAIEALKKNPNITDVELDSKVYALQQEIPWGVDRIDAEIVHTNSNNRGAGVKVAIIDTGIDKDHEDLTVTGGKSFVDYTDDFDDDDGHGTHVAGIVAALDNYIGVVGVAPEAELYALKVLDDTGSGYLSDVIFGIQWATDPDGNGSADDRLDIINMSLGADIGNIFFKWACNLAYRDGLLLVAAAGNENGGSVIYPAAYAKVIAVSATDYDHVNNEDILADFSSTGSEVELAAPGVNINSTSLDGGYIEHDGTSMASPHVAGTAALIWAANPSWSNKDVRECLQNTAENIGLLDIEQGYGLVDAAEAVGAEASPPDTGTIAGNVINASTSSPIAGATVVVEGTSLSTTTDVNGDYEITNVSEGTYTVTASLEGYESASQEATVSDNTITYNVDFALNLLPATGTMYVESITFYGKKAGKNLFLYTIVDVSLKDNGAVDGARVTMTLTNGTSSWNFSSDTGSDGTVKFTLKKAQVGNYTATVTEVSHPDYAWDEDETFNSCVLNKDGTVD